MASPSNASEPESPEEEEAEEEIIQAGFDPIIFWEQYRQMILLGAAVVLLGLAGFGIYSYHQYSTTAAAVAAFSTASTQEEYNQIIDKYPGTVAAGNAALMLASELRDARKYDDATQVLQTFLEKNPNHPLADAAELGIAETLEAQGKFDDAIAQYQDVTSKYPDSYSAPLALIAQANILRYQGKIEDARRAYENFVAQFPDSIFSQEAMAEMHMLRAPKASASPAQDATTNSLMNAINAAVQQQRSGNGPVAPPPGAASPHP